MRKKYLALSSAEEKYLKGLVSKGRISTRLLKRAMGLLQLNQGKSLRAVARSLDVAYQSVARWRDNYLSDGLKALEDRQRSGRPILISGKSRARITALACSTPPEGHARWTLRLLADKAVELGICENLSHTKVRQILKKTN